MQYSNAKKERITFTIQNMFKYDSALKRVDKKIG